MRKLLRALILALALTAAAGCGGDGDGGTLNLFTWEGMFPQEFLDGFEQSSGVKINYVNFDYGETMLAKLESSGGGDYDLVIVDDYIIEIAIESGLAQRIDKSKIKNYSNINANYQRQFFDPADEYTVPHGAGVQTIVYNPAKVPIMITGYSDLWDESLRGAVGIIGNYRVINGMALKVLGKSYNTEDGGDIRAAGDKLIELAPNIRLIKDSFLEDDLLSGEISAAVMYTSQVTAAMLADPSLEVVYPSEGLGFGIMAAFIPSNAPNAEAAHKFLDYLLDAEQSARCFEYLGYYSTNAAADPLIAEEFRGFLTLPAGIGGNMEMIQNISPDSEELHSRIWTEFLLKTE